MRMGSRAQCGTRALRAAAAAPRGSSSLPRPKVAFPPRASSSSSSTPSSASPDVPVLICPGFLTSSSLYEEMAQHLRDLGHKRVDIVPMRQWDWYSSLNGGDFEFYLDRLDRSLQRLAAAPEARGRPVTLVAHSAGGWIARLLLGEAKYNGRVW
jgi:triacylglycerol esterase/lipase EstA (alpha/beta hydrolase family)